MCDIIGAVRLFDIYSAFYKVLPDVKSSELYDRNAIFLATDEKVGSYHMMKCDISSYSKGQHSCDTYVSRRTILES